MPSYQMLKPMPIRNQLWKIPDEKATEFAKLILPDARNKVLQICPILQRFFRNSLMSIGILRSAT
jgi:hypothetical protein